MDQDRHCGPVEMGHTHITLKDAKQTVGEPEKFSTTQLISPSKKVKETFDDDLHFNIEMGGRT